MSNCKIAILYVTKDDFIKEAAKTMLKQKDFDGSKYKNASCFVLDDSQTTKYKEEIDRFAKENNCKVIRRGSVGPRMKCGNINFFIKNFGKNYDFYVILDSDTYIEEN
ncbi:MAG: hypothetical protein K2L48_02190 [Mycoplasmoidaceae bacterium]|nr:hypothetical protein [Mycoplasmoidaceae bacterium]